MRIYVASSWRNNYQPDVVKRLREEGHEVYDFKDADGFSWSEVDPHWNDNSWLGWKADIPKYIAGLSHPCAERGFKRDMDALKWADACLMVMPCGPSASMEMGWAVGAGKEVAVWTPEIREPDLMVKMAHLVTEDFAKIMAWVAEVSVKYVPTSQLDY